MLYGRGAGGDPTATSVVGDIIEIARGLGDEGEPNRRAHAHPEWSSATPLRRIRPIEEMSAQYYVLMRVADRPGVLAAIANVFSAHEVSIKSVWQEGHGEEAQLVLVTHREREDALQACVSDLRDLDAVKEVSSVIRVEAGEP
jgi:homoserine dehydrogenase